MIKTPTATPTPSAASTLRLRLPSGQEVGFERESTSIGRDPSCDIVVDDETVSSRHASVERHPQGWLVADVESENGTFLDGERVTQALLKPGQELRLGTARLRVTPSRAFDPTAAEVLARPAQPPVATRLRGEAAAPSMSETEAAARLDLWPGANAEEVLDRYERMSAALHARMADAASEDQGVAGEQELRQLRAACNTLLRRG